MTTTRRITLAMLATSVLLCTGLAQAQSVLDQITKTKKVRVAIPVDYPPYGFAGLDLQPQGLDIDMAHYIAKRLGAEAELITVTSANRIPYLQTGKVDIVVSTLGKTPEREQVIDFTHAYSPFFQAVFAPKGTTLRTWADMAGKSVSVTKGAMADTELTKVIPAGVDVKRFDDHIATVAAFVSGQVGVIATSATEGAVIMKQNPRLNVEYKLLLKESPNYVGVAKGQTALKDRINAIILEARKNGDIDRLSSKWLGRSAGDLPL